ncbi:hypothetical protein [Thiomonas sp. X19]|nr:hypothetical protein [Thiomonas sp. X19]
MLALANRVLVRKKLLAIHAQNGLQGASISIGEDQGGAPKPPR